MIVSQCQQHNANTQKQLMTLCNINKGKQNMAENILKSSTLPIHTGINARGTISKIGRPKKGEEPYYFNTPVNLMIGKQQQANQPTFRTMRSNSPTRSTYRKTDHLINKPSTAIYLTQRNSSLAHPARINQEKTQKKGNHSFDRKTNNSGLTWLRWNVPKKKAFRVKPSFSHKQESNKNDSTYEISNVETPKKVIGYRISAQSPMNKKLNQHI